MCSQRSGGAKSGREAASRLKLYPRNHQDHAYSACDTQTDEVSQDTPIRVATSRADDGVRAVAGAADRAVVRQPECEAEERLYRFDLEPRLGGVVQPGLGPAQGGIQSGRRQLGLPDGDQPGKPEQGAQQDEHEAAGGRPAGDNGRED